MWTINNQSMVSYGVAVAGWEEHSMNTGVLTLEVATADYTTALSSAVNELAFGDVVSVEKDSVRVWYGRVTSVPRQASGTSEGMSYEISDVWWYLENLIYMQDVDTHDGTNAGQTATPKLVTTGKTGSRIEEVVNYAIAAGAPMQLGTIDAGIQFWDTEIKDTTCADAIRNFVRLTPRYTVFIDHTTTPPTLHCRAPENLTQKSFDIEAGDIMENHSIRAMHERQVPSVVINYSKPIQVGDSTWTKVTTDRFPATIGDPAVPVTGKEFGSVVLNIDLEGLVAQYEYAYINTKNIPPNGSTSGAAKVFWVDHSPELKALADKIGQNTLTGAMFMPLAKDEGRNIFPHTLKLANPEPALPPLNPNAVPVAPANDVDQLPYELVDGSIPAWLNKRQGQINCHCTILIKEEDFKLLTNDQKAAVREVFSSPKKIGNVKYIALQVSGSINATDASKGTKSRLSSYNSGEAVPVGVAEDFYNQISPLRHEGSLDLAEQEVSLAVRMGDSVAFTNGRAEWAGMDEPVQSVSYDVYSGRTNITYGPPEQLGIQDLLGMQRSAHRTKYQAQQPSGGTKPKEAVGGQRTTVNNNFSAVSKPEPPAQSHFCGPLNVQRESDGSASIELVPTRFHEMTHSTVKTHTIHLGLDELDGEDPVTLTLAVGEHKLYVEFTTDEQGEITDDVNLYYTTGSIPASTNHKPPSEGSSGTVGDYKKHVGTYIVPSDHTEDIIYKAVSSPEWIHINTSLANVGDGAKMVKDVGDDGTYNLRTLKADDATAGTGFIDAEVELTEDGDVIKIGVKIDEEDLPSGGTAGLSGDLKFRPNGNQNVLLDQTFLGGAWQGQTATVNFQTPIEAGDHIQIENFLNPDVDPSTIMLANAGFKPIKGTVGFRKCNGCLNGKAAKAWLYGTPWMDASLADPDESDQDSPTEGGTIIGS